MEPDPLLTTQVLGVPVAQLDPARALSWMAEAVARDRRSYVCVTGVHGVMEAQSDAEVLAAHVNADLVVPDGMPLVWISRRRGFQGTRRVYGPDLMLSCVDRGRTEGWRHFFYGGAEGVAERLAGILGKRFPGLAVTGTWSPPFRPLTADEEQAVATRIDQARPHIVWVGLSTPKQELWMARMRPRLAAPVLIGVGAAFDFHAGLKRQAPRWMMGLGLEWLFRMLSEPRRLGPRYLINNPRFAWRVLTTPAAGPARRSGEP